MTSSPRETWRLLDTGEAPGAWNMAVDEALLLGVGAGKSPPTVRFFQWRPPCLSLGYFQAARRDVDLERCRTLGIDIVRRPTGGRAVLHDRELTYSVAAPDGHATMRGGVEAAYRGIAAGLVLGLGLLGADVRLGPPVPGPAPWARDTALPRSGACFDTATASEVTVRGRKLVGSAQVRRDGTVLQHGALLLDFDAALYLSLFLHRDTLSLEELSHRVISLREALGRDVRYAEVGAALREGFQRALGVELAPGELSPEERRVAGELAATRYGTPEWNLAR